MHFFVFFSGDFMNKVRRMLFIAIIDAIATQLYINIFGDAFRISLAVAILPVFYYIDQELNPLYTGLFISIVGLFFRGFVNINVLFSNFMVYIDDINIIVFDLVYALIFFYFFYKQEEKPIFNWIMVVFFADIFANIAELISRNISVMENLNELIVVAFVRGLISLGLLLAFYYFRSLFKKEIDRKKYNDLISIFSDVKSEVYLMNNNIKYIEDVMTDAYILYDDIEKERVTTNKNKALKIAQNVHEIKKNYIGILNGLSGLEFNRDIYDSMKLSQMINIIEQNTKKYIEKNALDIELSFNIYKDIHVKKHYYLMSILRNLVNNSVEALESIEKKHKKINITCDHVGDNIVFSVFDNGLGIKEKNLEYVFNNGFSTKFTNDGKIHRGLGLNLVKEIVEKEFDGSIEIQSNEGRFTKVTIQLKLSNFEEDDGEFFYY